MDILIVSLLSLSIAQTLKIFNKRPPDVARVISSGGMPSSHSALVSSMTTMVALKHGIYSDFFAVATVFSLIVIYDASGVRRAVGKQAVLLNQLIKHLKMTGLDQKREFITQDLKELIGHTPFEAWVGTLLGIGIALIAWYY